ncbi:MAG: hypothetical protein HY260_11835 [Chloroflexi bacterium]|nr:hypothetical protein [Chloroflexota bacterium]
MIWAEIRKTYPEQWLVIEALEAHTEGQRRLIDKIAALETCADGAAAMRRYRELHRQFPQRELYFVHTRREVLEILERPWSGIRRNNAAQPSG